MGAALLSFALAASAADPFADAFWHKDLGLLVALLAEPGDWREDEARALFADLVRLVNCEPLPPIPNADPTPLREERQLIRLERARRARLGAAAASSATLWRDILSTAFFNRALGAGPEGTVLFWPVETEKWSNEALRAKVRASACAAVGAATAPGQAKSATELELASEVLLLNLRRAAAPDKTLRPAAARLAYQRAVLLARAGQTEAAKQAAAQILPPELLGPALSKYALLLRLELGVDPPEGYAALYGQSFGANQAAVDERLAYGLHRSGSWALLEKVTAAPRAMAPAALCDKAGSPLPRDLLYRHALAQEKLGATAEVDAVLAQAFPACASLTEPAVDALKDLAITHYARRTLDAALEQRLKELDPPGRLARDVQKLGARALHAGNLTTAGMAMGWLITDRTATGRARGWVLEAEIAYALQDGKRFDRAVQSIFPDPAFDSLRAHERDERDRAVEELAQALVTTAEDEADADFRKRLHAQLPVWRERAAIKREPSFNALLAALESRPVPLGGDKRKRPTAEVAVGSIQVAPPEAVIPPPEVQFDWPEPYSLLAVPPPPGAPRGADFRAWFGEGDDAKR
ncbi:MAG TPA: hypothetical protein VFA20_07805 [Myxococcaceae bacterium]|nr:hypothetical protein [Myxococcaceae bacterium]